jgi:hypothetical protein
MKLIRHGQNRCERDTDSSYHYINKDGNPDEKAVRMYFSNFGYGDRRSKFGAELKWEDVRWLVEVFNKMGHPEAREHNAIIERERWAHRKQLWEDMKRRREQRQQAEEVQQAS